MLVWERPSRRPTKHFRALRLLLPTERQCQWLGHRQQTHFAYVHRPSNRSAELLRRGRDKAIFVTIRVVRLTSASVLGPQLSAEQALDSGSAHCWHLDDSTSRAYLPSIIQTASSSPVVKAKWILVREAGELSPSLSI